MHHALFPIRIAVLLSMFVAAASAQAAGSTRSAATKSSTASTLETFPSEAVVFDHVRTLAAPAMEGRLAGSPGGRRAGNYVAEQFRKLGITPVGDSAQVKGRAAKEPAAKKQAQPENADGATAQGAVGKAPEPVTAYHQTFDWVENVLVLNKETGVYGATPRKVACHNIVGRIDGAGESDEFLIIGAHYDHLGERQGQIYLGADDNASGVAGLLSITAAVAAAKERPKHTIYFVAFDAEERGLRGAKHFARHPPRSLQQCIAMINLDMIGRGKLLDYKKYALLKPLIGIPKTPAVGVLGTSQSPELDKIAREIFAAAELPLFAPEDFGPLRATIEKQAAGRSDHAPFEARKIPFLFFSTSENDDYHKPSDSIDKVDSAALHKLSHTVYEVVRAIDALPERPTFVAAKPKANRAKKVEKKR